MLDPAFAPRYLGGWQKGRARDGRVNDNFSVFVVRAKSAAFAIDNKEIVAAKWLPWKEVCAHTHARSPWITLRPPRSVMLAPRVTLAAFHHLAHLLPSPVIFPMRPLLPSSCIRVPVSWPRMAGHAIRQSSARRCECVCSYWPNGLLRADPTLKPERYRSRVRTCQKIRPSYRPTYSSGSSHIVAGGAWHASSATEK